MATRTWIAVTLCFLIWVGYLNWFAPKPIETPPNVGAPNPIPAPVAGAANTPDPIALLKPVVRSVPSATYSTEKFRLVFSAVGGRIHQIELFDYRETLSKDSRPVTPIEPAISPLTFATLFSEGALKEFEEGNYEMQQGKTDITFIRKTGSGPSIKKQYQFSQDSYFIDANFQLQFPIGATNDWGTLLIPVGVSTVKFDQNEPMNYWEAVWLQNEKVSRTVITSLPATEELKQGVSSWLSFGNRYFSSVVLHQSEINPDIVLVGNDIFKGGYLRFPLLLKMGQNELEFKFRFYVGPKIYSNLSQEKGMAELIDYGMFAFVAYPLLEILRFFYKFVHNYGTAIILLTILVKLIFYPLSLKSAQSMKAMQKIQPQIQKLKEKYAEDKERFNREQVALFKAHKVNPAGGCLPILVQLPVFIALYSVLGNSIELFHAPFFGWISDLAAKDPYYIYPILMGVAMLLQQRMTPTVGLDPMQAKMMYLMPVVFSFFMLNLPSGLTMYIFVSTILGILQQYLMTRDRNHPPTVVASQTP